MLIRDEAQQDHQAVRQVVESAFNRPQEADLTDALRRDGDAEISLVAEEDGVVVGHIMLSPMTAPVRTLGLGPVSVVPARQRAGIGSALIREAIARARHANWQAVFLLGAPEYYSRFGFEAARAAPFSSPYAGPYFMALELDPGVLEGKTGAVEYARAFADVED